MGQLFGFCVMKNAELPVGDERRKYKYRVVFQGNKDKDQNWDVAVFNELASQPATMEASRIADIYSCFEGHTMQGRDVEQAYLQAEMEGVSNHIAVMSNQNKSLSVGLQNNIKNVQKSTNKYSVKISTCPYFRLRRRRRRRRRRQRQRKRRRLRSRRPTPALATAITTATASGGVVFVVVVFLHKDI